MTNLKKRPQPLKIEVKESKESDKMSNLEEHTQIQKESNERRETLIKIKENGV